MNCETCFDTLTIDSGGRVKRCPDCLPTCIANSDTSKGPEIPLWECPCAECTKLEYEATYSDLGPRPTLGESRRELWPDFYPSLEALAS